MAPRKPDPDAPPPRRKRGFEPAATLLPRALRAPAESRGFAEARVLTHWAETVGPELAAMAQPLRISYGRGFGGTLVLLAAGAQAPLVEMRGPEIVEKVNAAHGYRAVSRVQVTQTARTGLAEGQAAFGAAPPPPAREPDPARLAALGADLGRIEDTTLRGALAALARNVLTARQD